MLVVEWQRETVDEILQLERMFISLGLVSSPLFNYFKKAF